MPVSRGRPPKRRPKKKTKRRTASRSPEPVGPLLVDTTQVAVARLFPAAVATANREFASLMQAVLPEGFDPGQELDPVEAAAYLHAVREALGARARELAQVYSQAEWLWYTRRTGRAPFRGHLRTTEMADHALLETLTGLSATPSTRPPSKDQTSFVLPVTPAALAPVGEMALIAVTMSQVHAWIRRAGKGTRFLVAVDDLPEPVRDEDLEAAITEYDERVAEDSYEWHPTMSSFDGEPTSHFMLLGAGTVGDDFPELPAMSGRWEDPVLVRVHGHYLPQMLTLDALEAAIHAAGANGERWWTEELASIVIVMQCLFHYALTAAEHLGVNLVKGGYTGIGRDFLVGMVDDSLPTLRGPLVALLGEDAVPTSGAAVVAAVEGLTGELWPHVPGPILRQLADGVTFFDFYTATRALARLILVPRSAGGSAVNAVADSLEDQTQDLIDSSLWRPSDELRALRRRKLMVNGVDLTDLDAVGELDDTLLIVSNKNLSYSVDYDAGVYNVVRNARTTVEEAVTFWSDVRETLESTPVGDNYDLSRYRRVIAVVVTPHVVFVQAIEARDQVATSESGVALPAASSLGELRAFLGLDEVIPEA